MSPPSSEKWNQMFQVYSICTLFLFIKYFITTMYAINNDNHPEEDKMLPQVPVPADIKRRERVFLNDLENIPFHMAILWGAFIVQCFCNATGHGDKETTALTVLIIIYSCSRLFFTLCYIFAIQPFRTMCFVIGNGAIACVCCVMVASAFQVNIDSVFQS